MTINNINSYSFSPNDDGSKTAKPIAQANVPKITTGKMYNKSFGQAGSPQ